MGDRVRAVKRGKPNADGTVLPRVRNPEPADGARPERARRKVARRKEERAKSAAASGGAAESHGLHLPGGPPEDGGLDLAVVPNAGPRPTYEELLRFHEFHTKGVAPAAVDRPADTLAAPVVPGPPATAPSLSPVRTLANRDSPDIFRFDLPTPTACASLHYLLTQKNRIASSEPPKNPEIVALHDAHCTRLACMPAPALSAPQASKGISPWACNYFPRTPARRQRPRVSSMGLSML